MSKLPKYVNWRPDFEAPGPYVTIEKKQGIQFDEPISRRPISDDDDDFTSYKYYESDKILGQLYRAIDEQKIFKEIQKRSQISSSTIHTSTVMHAVWGHVQRTLRSCRRLIQWEHHKQWATDIRDEYATPPPKPSCVPS